MGTKIISMFHRPAHSHIDELHEYACTFPLDIHERINIRTISVFFNFLVIEHSQCGTISRRIPIRIVGHIGTYLHLHNLLHDIELPIPTRIDGDHRQRYDVLIRGQLEQCLIVKMQPPKLEILGQSDIEHADGGCFLLRHRLPVIINMVLYQRPAGINVQFPMRNADRTVQRRRGNLAEIIVPFVMVRIIVLLIVVRLLQVRAEMGIERNRALAVAPERIDIESHIRINAEIIDFLSEESVVSVGIPMEIILVLSFHTAIEISRVPHRVAFLRIKIAVRREHVIVHQLVTDTDIDGGHDGVARPWLQFYKQLVLELHDTDRVGRSGRIDIELVVIQVPGLGIFQPYLVLVNLPVSRILA